MRQSELRRLRPWSSTSLRVCLLLASLELTVDASTKPLEPSPSSSPSLSDTPGNTESPMASDASALTSTALPTNTSIVLPSITASSTSSTETSSKPSSPTTTTTPNNALSALTVSILDGTSGATVPPLGSPSLASHQSNSTSHSPMPQGSTPVSTPAQTSIPIESSLSPTLDPGLSIPSSIAPTRTTRNSRNNVGAIAGGTVGGFVALALIGSLIFCWFVRRRQQRIAPSAAYKAVYGTGPPPMFQRSETSQSDHLLQLSQGNGLFEPIDPKNR